MADAPPAPAGERGGFDRGFGGRGRGRGDRGRGRGRGRGRKDEGEEKWVPVTKLGRLVQQVKAPWEGSMQPIKAASQCFKGTSWALAARIANHHSQQSAARLAGKQELQAQRAAERRHSAARGGCDSGQQLLSCAVTPLPA